MAERVARLLGRGVDLVRPGLTARFLGFWVGFVPGVMIGEMLRSVFFG